MSKRTTKRVCATVFLVGAILAAITLNTRAQSGLLGTLGEAAKLYEKYSALSPANAGCYQMLKQYHECLAGQLTGRFSSCFSPTCSIAPAIPSSGNVAGVPAGARAGAANLAGGAAQSGGVDAAQAMQAVSVGIAVTSEIWGIVKRHKAKSQEEQRARQAAQQRTQQVPTPPGSASQVPTPPASGYQVVANPQFDQEARALQGMSQVMARESAELQRAKQFLARRDQIFSRRDELLARARALSNGGTSATAGTPAAVPAAVVMGQCAAGWQTQTFPVDALGSDDLWLQTGALAFVTDDAGRASSTGSYLSIEYSAGRETHLFWGIGSPDHDLAPGGTTRIAVRRTSNSVDVTARYCKE